MDVESSKFWTMLCPLRVAEEPLDLGHSAALYRKTEYRPLNNLQIIPSNSAITLSGRRSFSQSEHLDRLVQALAARSIRWFHCSIHDEPMPGQVDEAVANFRPQGVDAVLGVGGGSALDAAKAIAGLLPFGNSVMDHLEGVGCGVPYLGPATPFVAVPTAAGTGSEATRNAVITQRGNNGFKKSFRHESLVAHAGLGSVHGLASSLGAYFPIPHGVVCGTLLAEAVALNLDLLKVQAPHGATLEKYARVGALMEGEGGMDPIDAHQALVTRLRAWTTDLGVPTLRSYGVSESDILRILAGKGASNMASNPATMCDDDLAELIGRRL